jgi:transcriptional regulator with XRE-family HTH domain
MQQKEVAKLLGVKPSTYGMYERGEREPSLYSLYKIASLFKVSADYLLGLESNNSQNKKQIATEYLTVAELLQRQNISVDVLIKMIESLQVVKKNSREQK